MAGKEIPLMPYDCLQRGFRRAEVGTPAYARDLRAQLLNLQEHAGPLGIVLRIHKECWIARFRQYASHTRLQQCVGSAQFFFFIPSMYNDFDYIIHNSTKCVTALRGEQLSESRSDLLLFKCS